MATLDTNIALGVRPIQVENPVEQYSRMMQLQNAQNQNALAQYQIHKAKREDEATDAMNALYSKHYNPETGAVNQNALLADLASSNLGSKIPDIQSKLLEAQSKAATLAETKQKTDTGSFKLKIDKANKAISDIAALNSPQEAVASIDQHVKNGDIDQSKADMLKGQLAQAPSFGAWQKSMLTNILDAKEKLTLTAPKPTEVNLNNKKIFIDLNPNSPTFQKEVAPQQTVGMTPNEAAMLPIHRAQLGVSQGNLAVNQGQLSLAQQNATKPVFNAQAGGFVAPPTKENPQGQFIPATEIQTSKDQQAAIKALKSAGYDPTTGQDNISKLIEKSTSGGLQAGTSATLAFFGKTTEGRKAIASLEGTANQIATDLAGGKLGAGISNTDRDFIVGALGDVANPMKTSAERLAGWNAAKNRMMGAGLIPPPAGAASPAAPKVAPNIDALLNKYK